MATKDKFSFSINGIKYTDIKGGLMSDILYINVGGTSQMVLQWMKQKYPNIPKQNYYWIKSKPFANGDSIDVYLNNAPDTFANELKNELEAHFERATKHYASQYSATKIANKTDEGQRISYGTKYFSLTNFSPSGVKSEDADWSILNQPTNTSKPMATRSSSTKPIYSMGDVIKECAGWVITKKTLPDGRIVYNAKIKPDTPVNKNDWQEIKNEVYTQTGFKWGRFGAFEKWGVIASEAAVVEILCKILDKYYPTQTQASQVQTQPPLAQAQSQPQEELLFQVGDRFSSITDLSYFYEIITISGIYVEVEAHNIDDGTTDILKLKTIFINNLIKDGKWVKYEPQQTTNQNEEIRLFFDGEYIDSYSTSKEAYDQVEESYGVDETKAMYNNAQIIFASLSNRVDVISRNYVYGEKWGIEKADGNILQLSLIYKEYKVYVGSRKSASKNVLVIYKVSMLTDGVLINDNGGEFTIDKYENGENLGSISYVSYQGATNSVYMLATEIDELYKEKMDLVQQTPQVQTSSVPQLNFKVGDIFYSKDYPDSKYYIKSINTFNDEVGFASIRTPDKESIYGTIDEVSKLFESGQWVKDGTYSYAKSSLPKSKEDIQKAINGLRYLADKGNDQAAKAIKGLEYLLNK